MDVEFYVAIDADGFAYAGESEDVAREMQHDVGEADLIRVVKIKLSNVQPAITELSATLPDDGGKVEMRVEQ